MTDRVRQQAGSYKLCGYNVNIALRAGVILRRTGKTIYAD
jgi:hypothetical protein